jgi:hypothetical protein
MGLASPGSRLPHDMDLARSCATLPLALSLTKAKPRRKPGLFLMVAMSARGRSERLPASTTHQNPAEKGQFCREVGIVRFPGFDQTPIGLIEQGPGIVVQQWCLLTPSSVGALSSWCGRAACAFNAGDVPWVPAGAKPPRRTLAFGAIVPI